MQNTQHFFKFVEKSSQSSGWEPLHYTIYKIYPCLCVKIKCLPSNSGEAGVLLRDSSSKQSTNLWYLSWIVSKARNGWFEVKVFNLEAKTEAKTEANIKYHSSKYWKLFGNFQVIIWNFIHVIWLHKSYMASKSNYYSTLNHKWWKTRIVSVDSLRFNK